MVQFHSICPEKTYKLGKVLGQRLKQGQIVCLVGDLGSGKTTFAQGVAVGMDVNDYVNSPTYTIVKEYLGRYPFYHMDVYRLGSEEELIDIGFDEYVYDGCGVTLIEWADLIPDALPEHYLWIEIKSTGKQERMIDMTGNGKDYDVLIKELLEEWES